MTANQSVNVTHDFIMSAGVEVLAQVLVQLGCNDKYVAKCIKRGVEHARVVAGTKLANSAEHSTLYAAGTLRMQLDVEVQAEAQHAQAEADDVRFAYEAEAEAEAQAEAQAEAHTASASATKSAKAWLHELFNKRNSAGAYASYTLAELCALTGKTEVNVRTMLSDLRSVKYAGKYGVLNTRSTRSAGVTRYSL